jgi:fumarylacetoacetate (FAA) hydrolase family protein
MRLTDILPLDWRHATLTGRIETSAGPTPVVLRGGRVMDISAFAATSADALSRPDLAKAVGEDLGGIRDLTVASVWEGGDLSLLSPIDLQCVKASGVTFAVSALERVIEERARGDADRRPRNPHDPGRTHRIGDLSSVKPGSPQAEALKTALIADGLWSQYLEVAIGPDAEIFTKAPCLSSVGWGDCRGARRTATGTIPSRRS